jgi:hypothetical protein
MWHKKDRGSIPIDLSWSEIVDKTFVRRLKAESIDGSPQGPWITAKGKALQAIKRIIGKSKYTAREGANNGGLAGAYWINLKGKETSGVIKIENLFDDGKIKVEAVEAQVESSIVYPLLRWSDMTKWNYKIQHAMLVPNIVDDFAKPIPINKLPKLSLQYFRRFETQLSNRALYKKYLQPQGYPFYAIYNVGPYTLSPLKVCWQTMGERLRSVVVSESDMEGQLRQCKPIVPQHTIVFIPLTNLNEAHFISSIMNSSISEFIARSYSMGKSFGNPHILDYISIPKYDEKNSRHKELSKMSQQCHEKVAAGISVSDLEEQIDELAAELWGLTKDELKDIKESLEEMR